MLDAELNTPEGEEPDRLFTLVELYEAEHYPIEDPDPDSLLEFLLDQQIVSRKQMEDLAGGSESLDAMLASQQALAAELAQLLHEHTGMPVEELLEIAARPTSDAADGTLTVRNFSRLLC